MAERQLTFSPHGHILTNTHVWSADGEWIVYDVRSDRDGALFDGTRIEAVHARTGETRRLYESRNGACCGVATCSPCDDRVVFILGPEHPTPDWTYAANHRQGVVVRASRPGEFENLDARDLSPPFTPGALRGGTHVHVFRSDAVYVSFTYEDAVLPANRVQREVGVCLVGRAVCVPRTHARNHDGSAYSVLLTRTTETPAPGSDEISRAYEDAWVGDAGRSIAFLGDVRTADDRRATELFIVELPDDVSLAAAGAPLAGTVDSPPNPPPGVVQRRITRTAGRRHAGLARSVRFWPRSSHDGSQIAFLMADEAGLTQLWTTTSRGDPPRQVTRDPWPVASAFTWSRDGRIAYVGDGSVMTVDAECGASRRITERSDEPLAPLPLACVFSPSGREIAYLRRVRNGAADWNQVFVASL